MADEKQRAEIIPMKEGALALMRRRRPTVLWASREQYEGEKLYGELPRDIEADDD